MPYAFLAAASAAADSDIVHQDVPWGTIMIVVGVIVISVMYFILVLVGKAPGLQLKAGNRAIRITPRQEGASAHLEPAVSDVASPAREYPKIDPTEDNLIVLAFLLTRRTYQVEKDIEAAQMDLIDEEYSAFQNYVDGLGKGFDGDRMWNHVRDCLTSVVKNNHILHYVNLKNGLNVVDPLYLNKRMLFIRTRFMEIGVKWTEAVENIVTTFLRLRLVKFAEAALSKVTTLREDFEAFALSTAHPSIQKLIETLRKEAGVDR